MTTCARLFQILTVLESKYGVSGIDPTERSIFLYILDAEAKNEPASSDDVIDGGITSCASTYGILSRLEKAGLISAAIEHGASLYRGRPLLAGLCNRLLPGLKA